jgi:hypothetical protein
MFSSLFAPSASGSNSKLATSTRSTTDAKPSSSQPRISEPNGASSEFLRSDHSPPMQAVTQSSSCEPESSKRPVFVSNSTMPCSLPLEGSRENKTCDDVSPVSSPKNPSNENPPPRFKRKMQTKVPNEQRISFFQPQAESIPVGRGEFIDTPVSDTPGRPYINREHIHAKQVRCPFFFVGPINGLTEALTLAQS